jgi:sigma-B regulation protein RsbU (phosphoserine phosphatase)
VSVFNTLTGKTLPGTDFGDPAAVMKGLNGVFAMERQGGHYFTIWYSVVDMAARTITYSGGGHPPALLLCGETQEAAKIKELECLGPPIGMAGGMEFENCTASLPPFARLLLYSDGAVEITQPDGTVVEYAAFNAFAGEPGVWDDLLERLVARAKTLRGRETLEDDCSLVQVDF